LAEKNFDELPRLYTAKIIRKIRYIISLATGCHVLVCHMHYVIVYLELIK